GRPLPQPSVRSPPAERASGGREAKRGRRRRARVRRRRRQGGGADLPPPRRQDDRPLRLPPRERREPGDVGSARGVLRRVLRLVEALEELREQLNLESLPLRIECFDISNIQASEPVGSMVVFQDATPKKAHYRKFAVRGLDGQDDFAAMAQVIARRFARMRDPADEEYDEGFAAVPNLVVIDGGKGQLSAALAAMQRFDLPRVAVIALAKRAEEVFLPGRAEPVRLDPHSSGLQLLQRIRYESP